MAHQAHEENRQGGLSTPMTKTARVDAALRGQAVDRVPISFWGHSYLKEWSAEGLAEAMIENYRAYDWDYVKVNPRASYHVEDWGAELTRPTDANTSPKFTKVPVREPGDFRNLKPLLPDRGALGEQLQALQLIRNTLDSEAYFIQTIFSPLSVAKYLVGDDPEPVKRAMQSDPDALKAGLATITETFRSYALACIEAGASGIFFATTGWASKGTLSEDDYKRYGIEYDLRVLDVVKDRVPLNVLHNCGEGIYFDLLADYPVAAISWAATLPSNPTLAEGKGQTRSAVMGGIDEKTTLPNGSPAQVAEAVRTAIDSTGGRRLLLAPGCSIPPRSPVANLKAAKRADEEMGAR